MSYRVLVVFGTRPEVIKLAPVIMAIGHTEWKDEVAVVSTSQHDELLEEQLRFWEIVPDYFLTPCPFRGDLVRLLAHTLSGLQDMIDHAGTVEYILVQGDTNTALACSMISFLNRIKLIHIEAGLRTFDFENPFPEEYNRVIASRTAWFHFAPTAQARSNLVLEGIDPSRIMVVGNTVVDALYHVQKRMAHAGQTKKKRVIITLHRRENISGMDKVLTNIIHRLAKENPDLEFSWITHPNCAQNIEAGISGTENIKHYQHIPYDAFVRLYSSAKMVITDSGGVSEEAIHLGLPVIIFRQRSERVEASETGYPLLISVDKQQIVTFFRENLNRSFSETYSYGDGRAAISITNWLGKELTSI